MTEEAHWRHWLGERGGYCDGRYSDSSGGARRCDRGVVMVRQANSDGGTC
jgi:hypothetical protein